MSACTAEKFDEPLCLASASQQSWSDPGAFAGGYFPPEFAEPSIDCGYGSGPRPIISDIEEAWYADQLKAGSEPSIYGASICEMPSKFALRLSYIPSFDPSVFVRIHSVGDRHILTAKRLDGAGGYDPGTLARSKQIELTRNQVADLLALIQTQRLFDGPADDCRLGFDGSMWIFEMTDKSGYRLIKRWSPTEGSAYVVGRRLFDLAGWDVETY